MAVPDGAGRDGGRHQPTTPFVGRERELARASHLVDMGRAVSFVGAPGSGKTRAACEFARRWSGDDPSRWVFVDLSLLGTTDDPDTPLVADAVARATGTFDVEAAGQRVLLDHVVEQLRDRDVLIVLDNCEHVRDGAAAAASALSTSGTGVNVVATSRQALGHQAESVLVIGSLERAGAELFAFVAAATGAAVDPASEVVAEICDRLDGHALAIELVAAAAATSPIDQLDLRLGSLLTDLDLPVHGRAPRHVTLAAAIAWSTDRLEPSVRRLFERLGVFVGSTTIEAIEEVCSDDDLPFEEVAPALRTLVAHSLVRLDPSTGRYRLIEPLRQCASEALRADPSGGAVELRHSRRALRRAREMNGQALTRGLDPDELDELPDLRAVIDRSITRGDGATALTILTRLGWTWALTGSFGECVDVAERALVVADDASDRLRLLTHSMLAGYLSYNGNVARGSVHADAARALLDADRDHYGARYLLSTAVGCTGDSPVGILSDGERAAIAADDYAFAGYLAQSIARWHLLEDELEPAYVAIDRAGEYARWTSLAFGGDVTALRRAIEACADPGRPAPADLEHAATQSDTPFPIASEATMIVLAASAVAPNTVDDFSSHLAVLHRQGWMQRVMIGLRLAGAIHARLGFSESSLALDESGRCLSTRCGYADLPLVERLTGDWNDIARRNAGRRAASAIERGRSLTTRAAVELSATPGPDDTPSPDALTERERAVLAFVASGADNSTVAARLGISVRTVDAHLRHVRIKLGLTSRVELVRWALAEGLSPLSSAECRAPR